MAGVTVQKTKLTHKKQDPNKPRRKLARTRVRINGQRIDLRKVAARRRLVVRQ